MSIQAEYLVEGKYTLGSLLESGVSSSGIAKIERVLKLPANSHDEKIFFVGFFEVENKLFISFPKSLNIDLLSNLHIRALMLLMRKISQNTNVTNRIPDNAFLRNAQNTEHLTRLNLAEFIVNDFLTHGDITFKSNKIITNNVHDPNWQKTIDSIIPITSGFSHIYDVWVSNKKWSKHDQIIKNIHHYVLEQCVQRYGVLFGVDEKEIVNTAGNSALPKNAVRLIDAKLREVYVQRDILILKALKKWLENRNEVSAPEFYGTQYFHIIWEEICSYLLKNRKNKDIWKQAFQRPVWTYYDTGQELSSSPFEVDVICEELDGKLILADAKYYDISLRDRGILSVADLSKQINYETQLINSEDFERNYASKENLINLFLFPADSPNQIASLFCDIRFPKLYERKLYGISLDITTCIDRYCSENPLSSSEIGGLVSDIG